ncbi:acyl-CoA dehydrogenase family protein [Sphingorhabdus sp.]|jgi:alkylation response protein AidB-like acyl-CoA dehydrogenase|uniref:acyl-CoA dehydrogenase family protein n=1 Tax=Sphingorhabdus sp. TaxID=1902408 RepID=UPI0037CA9126
MSRTYDILGKVGDEQAFRQEMRDWLAEKAPKNWRQIWQSVRDSALKAEVVKWLNERRAVGLGTPHWPKEWGGPGLPFAYQIMVYEEFSRADAPELEMFGISLFHTPATLFEHGTQAQKDKYLTGITEGTDIWCQGFSEPGAGSDLASLRTSAVLQGDHYVINGQKIWSSGAYHSDYCLLLARTDANVARKHDGISYFIMDMKTPGIEVRPINQINGEAHFAEMFMDDVKIPIANLIGAEGNGWNIAQSTLSTERGLLIFGEVERLARSFELDGQDARDTWMRDVQFRREYAALYGELKSVRLMIKKLLIELEANPDKASPTLPTYIKVTWGPFLQRYTEFLLRAEGLQTQKWQPAIPGTSHSSRLRMNDFLNSYGWTIAGGSNEIMRNIISERILGLPKG